MPPLNHIAVVHFEIPLGTAVLSLPSLCSLKKACPGIRITAFASGITLSFPKNPLLKSDLDGEASTFLAEGATAYKYHPN
jgi:hypothetical protein